MQNARVFLDLISRVESLPDPQSNLPEPLEALREKFWKRMPLVRKALQERGIEATDEEAAVIWLMYLESTRLAHTPDARSADWAANWFLKRLHDYRLLLRHPEPDVRLAALACLYKGQREWAEAYLQRALADLPLLLGALDFADDVLNVWKGKEEQGIIVDMAIHDPDPRVRAMAISLLPGITSPVLTEDRWEEVVSAGLTAKAWVVREALTRVVAFCVGPWNDGKGVDRLAVKVIVRGLQDVPLIQLAAAHSLERLALQTRVLTAEDWANIVSLVAKEGTPVLGVARDRVLAVYAATEPSAASFFRALAFDEGCPPSLRAHGVLGYLMVARDGAIRDVVSLWGVPDLRWAIVGGLMLLATEESTRVVADLLGCLVNEEGPGAALGVLDKCADTFDGGKPVCETLSVLGERDDVVGAVVRSWVAGRLDQLGKNPDARSYLARLLAVLPGKAESALAAWALGYPPEVMERVA